MNRFLRTAAGLTLAGVTAAFAAHGVAPQSVTLRLKLKQGQQFNYLANMTSSGAQGQPMNSNTKLNLKVLRARGNKFTVKMTATPQTGASGAAAQSQTVTATYDSLGNVTNASSSGTVQLGSLTGMNAGFMGLTYPQNPVKVGSKWSTQVDISKIASAVVPGMKVTGGKFPMKFSVKTISTKNGKTTLTIGQTFSGTMMLDFSSMGGGKAGGVTKANVKITSIGTMLVDAANGVLVSQNSDLTTVISFGPNQSMTQHMKVHLKRV